MEMFLNMNPPTITAQMHKIGVRNGKPYFYDPPELKDAQQKLIAYLGQYKPNYPMDGKLSLVTIWYFKSNKHHPGEFKDTRPDTDNLQKMLKDCMTYCEFWHDDAQVVQEVIEKRWSKVPGIHIMLTEAEE